MTALYFAHSKIIFSESSPITGRFDSSKYRMLEKPLLSLSDIRVKRNVWYKASSAMGTVALQIALAYWLDQTPHSIQVAMQSDDDAKDWSTTRGKKFVLGIDSIRETMSADKHAITIELWQWPFRFVKLTGPGQNARQGKQVTYLVTDESHVDAFGEGALAEFEERMSKRWNRMALHVTTAADEGKEVDRFFHAGRQNEWHFRCPKCAELVWPLWEQDAKDKYNGERVFIFAEGSDEIGLDCPHCEYYFKDTSRNRYALHEHGDYVPQNRYALPENESFRWNCFAAWWTPWSEQLNKYREAIHAAKMGNLQPHENFVKKRLCQSYRAEIPELGDSVSVGVYDSQSVWITKHEHFRDCSFDVQDSEGFHLWGQIDEWSRNGDSRRIQFARLPSWEAARAFQQEHGVLDTDTYCDAGHRMREVFGRCSAWRWYALLSSDDQEFIHYITDPKTKEKANIRLPYSMTQLEDSMSGKKSAKVTLARGKIPPGFCLSRRWSKPVIGGYLMSLKSGQSHDYGVPSDINPDFLPMLNSYVYSSEKNKKTGATSVFLKQVKTMDHAFATASQNLLGAIIRGYFPLAATQSKPEEQPA